MGKLQKYNDAVAVEEALDKGKAAHEALNGHTVKSDVPEGAKFTDTVYDDTAVKADISANTEAINQNKTDISSLGDKISNLTLGLHTDGLFYIFINNEPVGNGISLPKASGDVYGNVDSGNNIILNGDLADGNYYIKYEMADGSTIDIGELVLDNTVSYSVTNNLTNCTNSNTEATIAKGGTYSATITANSGYEISSIVVTMGGTDITDSAVSGSDINVATVTGNIIVTAIAEETTIEIINQIPLSTDTDGTIYNGVGYKTNTRIKGTGETETKDGVSCTGFIPVSVGDVVYVKGIVVNTQGYSKIHSYNASKATLGTASDVMIGFSNLTDEGNGVYSCTITNANVAYIRVSSAHIMDGSEIVTINQPIV